MVNMEVINESGHIICFTGLSKLSQMHVMADVTVSEQTVQLKWKNEIGGSPDGYTIDNRDVITYSYTCAGMVSHPTRNSG